MLLGVLTSTSAQFSSHIRLVSSICPQHVMAWPTLVAPRCSGINSSLLGMLTYRLSGRELLTTAPSWILPLARLPIERSIILRFCFFSLLSRDAPYVEAWRLKVRTTRGRSVGRQALTTPSDSSTLLHMVAGASDQDGSVSEIWTT